MDANIDSLKLKIESYKDKMNEFLEADPIPKIGNQTLPPDSERYNSCLSPFIIAYGQADPFNERYSFIMCVEASACLVLMSYVMYGAFKLFLNFNETRTRNNI
jgi:hypothetical protein